MKKPDEVRPFLMRPAVIDWLQWADFDYQPFAPDYPQMTLKLLAEYKAALESRDLRIEKLEAALGFYANKKNYGCDDKSRTTGNKTYDIVLFDFDRGRKKDYAGKRARQALGEKGE